MKNPLNSQKAIHRFFYGTLIFAILTGITLSFPTFFNRQTITVTITNNFSPRECRSRRSLFAGPKFRSERSGFPGLYCGAVTTDHGSFELPKSQRFGSLFSGSRENLFDLLNVGCTYEVTLGGFGHDLSEGRMSSTGRNRTLLKLIPMGECINS
jgi:hypothetical protein